MKNAIEIFIFHHNEKQTILCNFVKPKCEWIEINKLRI